MSDGKGEVSLDMLTAQLDAADDALFAVWQKRRSAERDLKSARDRQSGNEGYSPALAVQQARRLFAQGGDRNEDAIWLQLFAGSLADETVSKIVFSSAEPIKLLDHARAFFGHSVEMTPERDLREALMKCAEVDGTIGVFGWPGTSGAGQWWPALAESRLKDVRVVGAWPVAPLADKPQIAILGRAGLLPSGKDKTLAIAHDDYHKATKVLNDQGFDHVEIERARSLVLVELDGYVAESDPRIAEARSAGLDALKVIGTVPQL